MSAAERQPPYDATADRAEHWRHVATLSSAELHGRLRLIEALVAQRLPTDSPVAVVIIRAAQGWTEAELAAGERSPG